MKNPALGVSYPGIAGPGAVSATEVG
jgi:hypothetical protein